MRHSTHAILTKSQRMLKAIPALPLTLILAMVLVTVLNTAMPTPTSAAVAQRGTATTGTTTNTSLTISKPSGVVAGDVMLVSIAQVGNNSVNPTYAGWTAVAGANLGGNPKSRGSVLYKVADGTEGSTFTFTLGSGTTGAVGSMVAFSGVDTSGATPFDVSPGTILTANSTAAGATTITTVSADAAVIMFGMASNGAPTWSGWTTTSPGALTELYDSQNSSGGQASVGAAWAAKAVAGATGAGAATLSSAQRNGGILIALKPGGNPLPATASISPSAKAAGDAGFILTVDGTNFVNTSVVRLDGADRATTYVSSTQLTATIPASDLATAGSRSITVFNQTQGGGTSNAQTLAVGMATPTITWENPADIVYGTTLGDTQLRATASVPGTFVYTPGAGAVLPAGNGQTLHVDFTPTDTANYTTASKDAVIKVTPLAITVTVTPGQSKVYGQVDPLPLAYSSDPLVGGDSFSGALSRVAGESVGIYIIEQGTLALNSNYNLSFIGGTFTISARNIAVAADTNGKSYGESDPVLTYRITSGSLAAGDSFSGALSRVVGEDMGNYDIGQGTLALGSNYNLTFTKGTLTISVRNITVTADDKSKTYGDADPALTYRITSGSLLPGDDFSGAIVRVAGQNAGTYDIERGTLALSSNYNLTFVKGTFAISTRSIAVAADSKGKTCGGADPALTYQITSGSLVSGDSFTGSLARLAGENVGIYAINRGSLALNGNYNLTFVGNTVTISPKALTITANSRSKTYGVAGIFAGTELSVVGLVNGDTVTSVTLTSTGAAVGAAVGTYPIVPSAAVGTGLGNYTITYANGSLTVSQKALSITANSRSKTYGATVTFAGTEFSAVGLVNGDTVTGVTLTCTGAGAGATVGTYVIVPSAAVGTGLGNYSISYVNGSLTVKAPIAVPAAWSATTSGTNHLYSVWGSSPSDVFAVGNSGVILHFDGSSLSSMTSGTTRYLRGVWGSSATDVFVVGTGGTIRHYDGTSWSDMTSGTTVDLHGVWGSSASDVFAVGVSGTILHYDGYTWSPMTSGTANWLRAVWGTSGSDVFAVGNSGVILHYNGSDWNFMTSGTTGNLCGVWGSSGSDVFVVGASGITLHYNGSAWVIMASGTTNTLYGVWGTSGSDVFAVGYAGAIRHYNGSAWGAMTGGTTNTLLGIWGASSTEVIAVGYSGSILYYHQYEAPAVSGASPSQGSQGTTMNVSITGANFAGATSVSFSSGITVNSFTVNSITQISANISIGGSATVGARDVSVTAPGGSAVKTGAFTVCPPVAPAWSTMISGSTAHLYGIWGSSASDVFAVGNSGAILRYNGSTWSAMTSGTTRYLRGIWGSSASDVFAVGTGGTILYYDGAAWGIMTSGTANDLHAVWGASDSDVFAVGVGGTILHYDGYTWSPMISGTTNWLRAVWGTSGSDVFAMGDSGIILHYDGTFWNPLTSGTTANLCGVWGTSGSDVFAVGASGAVLHYDGSSWTAMTSGTTNTLYAIWGSSGSDVYAVGYTGGMRHYDGATWSAMSSTTTSTLLSVWGTSSTDAFVVGHNGTILRHHEYPAPAISWANPSQGSRGTTMDVTITGANFTGATLVSFGSGITVNNFTVNGDSQITANISIDGSAAAGARDVSVTTPGGTATKAGAFAVIA